MIQKHRISTDIGKDQLLKVEIKNNYDILEILSLKFTQQELYTSVCSDYGVVCGRVTVNNGLGIPNAKVSIFVPLNSEDENDPVISTLYPFKSTSDLNEDGYRYNLLPSRKQHGGHEPTGTFFDQNDILSREEVLEVFEKYYKYTVKTNSSGDFMIWGVPVGDHTLHVDVDLSDISCFSLRPFDFLRQGYGVDSFKSSYEFKSSEDLGGLPQIKTFDRGITVYPFWGNVDLCQIGITRTDFDLSDLGVRVEPTAFLMGSAFTDQGENVVSINCVARPNLGNKCGLTTEPLIVEAIRFTNRLDANGKPILEYYNTKEDIGEDGSFVIPLPMNLEYVYTNEFGENELTNDPNKGIATSGVYRFRITHKNNEINDFKTTASFLVPNIREFGHRYSDATASELVGRPSNWQEIEDIEIDKSYAWSTNFDDYPTYAYDLITNKDNDGNYIPQDYFYKFNYNKVYSISSFMSAMFSPSSSSFVAVKDIKPRDEEDCNNSVNNFPVNYGSERLTFSLLLAILINAFEVIIYTVYSYAVSVLTSFLYNLSTSGWVPSGISDLISDAQQNIQKNATLKLGITIYPDCESCDNIDGVVDGTTVSLDLIDESTIYEKVGYGYAGKAKAIIPTANGGNGSITYYSPTLPNTGDSYELLLSFTGGLYGITHTPISGNTLSSLYSQRDTQSGRFFLYNPINKKTKNLNIEEYELNYGSSIHYVHLDSPQIDNWIDWSLMDESNSLVYYEIYDRNTRLTLGTGAEINKDQLLTELRGGCEQYKTIYDEELVIGTYCNSNPNISYRNLTLNDLVQGTSCPTGKIAVGQVLAVKDSNANYFQKYPANMNTDANKASIYHLESVRVERSVFSMSKSGYSEFRNGLFIIVPAVRSGNWLNNARLIAEWGRRKLVGKLFCGGIVNYSFFDNWLTGSLYMTPFRSKIRWDNQETGDLNFYHSDWCDKMVHFVVDQRRFYYRSAWFKYNPTTKIGNFIKINPGYSTPTQIGRPTTIVDLGPRDEFIKEICVDPKLDPNCSVVRGIGPTSYQDFRDMLGLYINYKMDTNPKSGYGMFFDNKGFEYVLPETMEGKTLNGDITQLISINCEAGIESFDLQNRRYGVYNPSLLDPDNYTSLFKRENVYNPSTGDSEYVWGPLPINLTYDTDGYRVRACLNAPGNLTESSQVVPFYYWNKKGPGFGPSGDDAKNQAWDYTTIRTQPLQGMTFNYKYTGNEVHKYLLPPITQNYNGLVIDAGGLQTQVFYNEFGVIDNHTDFNNQEEGFTYLYITDYTGSSTLPNPIRGALWTRVGDVGGWASMDWTANDDFFITPTTDNYTHPSTPYADRHKIILSTPFLYYFGLRPGKTALDKLVDMFGPSGAFKNQG